MAAPSRVCLACGQATRPTNRRLLSSEASTTVRQVWTELLAERLKERHQEVSNIQSLIEDGCVCKKCFMAVKAFYDRKVQLMINLDVAIDNMPLRASAVQDPTLEAQQSSRKKPYECVPGESVKRRRLSSEIGTSDTQSPGVQVCILLKHEFNPHFTYAISIFFFVDHYRVYY